MKVKRFLFDRAQKGKAFPSLWTAWQFPQMLSHKDEASKQIQWEPGHRHPGLVSLTRSYWLYFSANFYKSQAWLFWKDSFPDLNWVTSAEVAIVGPFASCRVNHDFGGRHATCPQDAAGQGVCAGGLHKKTVTLPIWSFLIRIPSGSCIDKIAGTGEYYPLH